MNSRAFAICLKHENTILIIRRVSLNHRNIISTPEALASTQVGNTHLGHYLNLGAGHIQSPPHGSIINICCLKVGCIFIVVIDRFIFSVVNNAIDSEYGAVLCLLQLINSIHKGKFILIGRISEICSFQCIEGFLGRCGIFSQSRIFTKHLTVQLCLYQCRESSSIVHLSDCPLRGSIGSSPTHNTIITSFMYKLSITISCTLE